MELDEAQTEVLRLLLREGEAEGVGRGRPLSAGIVARLVAERSGIEPAAARRAIEALEASGHLTGRVWPGLTAEGRRAAEEAGGGAPE